ncbi:16S rRNA processing protein RimM [Natronospira proteinivora]|uniref:Ribosome maturation factor RimM n=1 Tax=Natronospira proteinivora TaxID=1807133 RepID=A0ABT1G4X1_9GAMM|nr:ribosome maturation factor RimM [Natronospira proteinivora]MCP1726330.1 16S rRNA processing protein RimM [Natronospira proteinivora]
MMDRPDTARSDMPPDTEMVVMGRVSGLFGVRGWVKIYSHARPRESIVDFQRWFLRGPGGWQPYSVVTGRKHGNGVVAQLEGVDDRDQAAGLMGRDIAIARDDLPATDPDEFYWVDLIGLVVETEQGVTLGRVVDLVETPANDVLVVQGDRERLVPFVQGPFIKTIDLDAGCMVVDWDPEF